MTHLGVNGKCSEVDSEVDQTPLNDIYTVDNFDFNLKFHLQVIIMMGQ